MTTDDLRLSEILLKELRRSLGEYDIWFTDTISVEDGNRFYIHMDVDLFIEEGEKVVVSDLFLFWFPR